MNVPKIYLLFLLIFSCDYLNADIIGEQTYALALGLQSNGRPVIAGVNFSCNKSQILVARYSTDGILDGTLNGTGYVSTIFGADAAGKAITLQTDGKIVVSGFSDNTIALLRFTTGGVLDSTFGNNGRVNLNLGLDEQGNAVMMQSGKILVAGNATVAGATQFFVCRFNSTGALDAGFGTSGITTTLIGDGASANAMATQSTGKIILAGTAVVNGQVVFALARYSSSGVLDNTFGISGTSYAPINTFAAGSGMVIDSSNRIILAGFSINNGNHNIAIARFTSNGTLDGTFGTSGVQLIDIPDTTIDQGLGVAIQADGNIVIAGKSGANIVVARLNGTNGSLDTTFGGGNGYVTTTIGNDAAAFGVAIQPADQMIVVAGYSDLSVVLARYDVDGNLDTTFGNLGTGWVIDPQGSAEATCGNCTVCPTGATGIVNLVGVTATNTITTTSATDTLMGSMTLTPASGTYLGFFNTDCSSSADDAALSASFYLNGIQLPESQRTVIPRSNGAIGREILSTQAVLTPNGSQPVEVRWHVSSGTGTSNNRSLHLLQTA